MSTLGHRSLWLPLAIVLLAAISSPAQFGVPVGNRDEHAAQPARMRELVSQYCRLDYEGDRLSDSGWTKMQPLVSWRANPDFPLVNVISRYTVDNDPVENHNKYTVVVHYRLIGRFNIGQGFAKDASTEDVTYTVSQVNGEWRITEADPNYPHPSRPAILKWLNDKLSTASDVATKTVYQQAITELQAPAATPPTK